MRYFKAWGSKIGHSSKDGKQTLCGRTIDNAWNEIVNLHRSRQCKRCEAIEHKTFEKGKQPGLDTFTSTATN